MSLVELASSSSHRDFRSTTGTKELPCLEAKALRFYTCVSESLAVGRHSAAGFCVRVQPSLSQLTLIGGE